MMKSVCGKRSLLLAATIISLSAVMFVQTPVKADTLAEAIANEATPSYSMEGNYTGALGSLAGADRSFTIYGNNHTISGNNTYTGIEVANGQTLGLDNVLWFYGTTGNIINNAGTLNISYNYDEHLGDVPGYGSVSNSNIMNITNRYTGDSEGLISFTSMKNTGTLNITENSLRPVNIITITDDEIPKGIINVKGGHLETSGLTQKTVNLKGGGLYVSGNLNSDVVVDGTLEHTGNLRIEGNNPAINGTISGTFKGNDYQGLHYYSNVNNNLTLNNVNFDNNSYEYDGGALYYEIYNGNGSGNLTLVNNQFTNNHARSGGAILSKTQGVTSITNGTFTGNYSTTNGGAIYQRGGTLSIKDSTFTSNKANDGAAIYSNYADVIIYAQNGNVEFTNNNSTGTASGTGTGISVYEGSLTLNADTGHNITIDDAIYSTNGMTVNANHNGGTVALNKALTFGGGGLTLGGGTLKLNSAAASSITESNLTLNGGAFDIANGAIDNLTFTNAINNTANSNLVIDASIGATNTADKITSDISDASTIFISGINFISDNKNGGEVQIADGNIRNIIAVSDVAGGYADVQYNSSTGVLSLANKIDWLQQANGAYSGYRFTKTNNGIMPVNYASGENNYTFYTDILKKNYTDDSSIAHDFKYTWNNATHTLTVTNSDGSALSTTKSTIVITGDGSAAAPFVYTGDHVGNTPIGLNRWNTFGTITGDFVGNTDGAIAMGMGVNIPAITGNFIGNTGKSAFIFSGDHSWGSSVTSITGDFIGNYSNYIYNNNGGAIFISNWNNGGIGTIKGDFIGNKADGSGGAICLADGYINSITGNFVNNYAVNNGGALQVGDGMNGANISVTGDFIANQAVNKGGAVYNTKGASTRLIDSSFIGNIAPEGAAIHNNNKYATLVVTAKNKDIEFTNNNSTGLSGGDGYGIYNIGQLTLNANADRTFTVNDKVYSEGNISINDYYADWAAQNGTVIFNNEITQTGATGISSNDGNAGGGTVIFNGATTLGSLDVSGTATLKLGAGAGTSTFGAVTFTRNPILDIANNSAQTLNVASIKNNAKLNIDLDFSGASVLADAINITTGGQTGVLTLDSINAKTSDTGAIRGFTDLAILTGETTNVTLAFSAALEQDTRFFGDEVESITREVNDYTDNATFGEFAGDKFTDTVYAHKTQNRLYLNDAKTTLSFGVIEVAPEYIKSQIQQDVLQALNQSTNASRTLTATDTNKNYTVSADLGTTGAGSLTVQGVEGSNLNMNNKSGFELSNANTTLTLSNLNITNVKDVEGGLISITGENSTANLEGVNVADTTNAAIVNNKTLNLNGTNDLGTGVTGTGNTNINGGKTVVDTITQNAVNITSGGLEVANITTTNGISNAGTLTLTGDNVNSSVTGSGKTVIDGTNVSVAYGNTIEQDITINSGKGLVNTNVSVIGGDVENNGTLQVYSKDNGKLEHDITGTGTTELNRDITVAANIDNAINIKSYTDAQGTHNANITVESGNNFGKAGQNITVDANNNLTMQSADDIKGNLVDNGTVELQSGTISNAISGTGDVNITGNVTNNAVSTISGDVFVASGSELTIGASGNAFSSANFVAMGDGSTLNLQNGSADVINDNLSVAADSSSNLMMDWGDKIGNTANINGELHISDVDLTATTSATTPTSYTIASGSNLGNILLNEDVNLKTNATSFNQVKYNSDDGTFSGTRNNLVQAVNTTEDGEYAIYAMSVDEAAGAASAGVLDGGKLIVRGNGKTINSYGIVVGDGTHDADLIIKDANMKNITGDALSIKGGNSVTLRAENSDIEISGTTGNAITLNSDANGNSVVNIEGGSRKVTIKNDIISDNSGNVVYFNSGTIKFDGLFDPAKAVVGGATVIRGGNDDGIDWTLTDGTLRYQKDSYLNRNTNTINMNGGTLDTRNGTVTDFNLNGFTLSADSNFYADVDLANKKMDNFLNTPTTYTGGTLHVAGLKLISDATAKKTSVPFANSTLKAHVDYTGAQKLTALSPIYKYDVNYNSSNGNFDFTRYGSGGYDGLNPAIMAASVAAQLGGYLTQLNSYDEAFRNMDMYMLMTASQRQALKNKNKIASLENGVLYDASLSRQERAAGWFRPYATFEKVGLKNGPRVSNVMYGSFMGGESKMYDLGHGWDGMWGAYVGYNGSHQNYDGVSIYQNGGSLGAVGMAYKGNFFTGLTLNAGANGAEASTMFGHEDFAMLMAGVASKTGYNWELAKGKFIIQPSMLMSYSFVNTFDYHNAAGIKIDSDPLHAIQLQPEIKFIGNLKNGWQPYASVAMIWNIMDDTKFKANNVSLPELSVKPYVKYGVGIRKTWGERFTGFFQTYLTNGGRNGVGLQLGFTWALGGGKNKKADEQKIQTSLNKTPELKKTEIVLSGHKIQ